MRAQSSVRSQSNRRLATARPQQPKISWKPVILVRPATPATPQVLVRLHVEHIAKSMYCEPEISSSATGTIVGVVISFRSATPRRPRAQREPDPRHQESQEVEEHEPADVRSRDNRNRHS